MNGIPQAELDAIYGTARPTVILTSPQYVLWTLSKAPLPLMTQDELVQECVVRARAMSRERLRQSLFKLRARGHVEKLPHMVYRLTDAGRRHIASKLESNRGQAYG